MPTYDPYNPTRENPLHLSSDEIAIVELVRVLGLSRDEALHRLAMPPIAPTLPACQELQANLAAVAKDLSATVEVLQDREKS